jgi:hypothetical protein
MEKYGLSHKEEEEDHGMYSVFPVFSNIYFLGVKVYIIYRSTSSN